MNEADLLVVFGASFSNHTGIYAGHPIVQVDSDPLQLGKLHPVEVPVCGEVGVTARLIEDALPERMDTDDQRSQLAGRWAIWRAEKESRTRDDRGNGVNSASVFAAMERQVADDAVIAVDVGNHAYSFGRYYECRQNAVLMSGYLGSIGFGHPAAIGARVAAPERPTVAVTGDGGFAQYMGELRAPHSRLNRRMAAGRSARQSRIEASERDWTSPACASSCAARRRATTAIPGQPRPGRSAR